MTDPNVWPADRTAPSRLGKPFHVQPKNFFGVHDPKYPWVGMNHSAPSQWKQWMALQAQQKHDVDHYVVIRNQYWKQTDRKSFGAETQATYTYEVGTTYSHTKTTEDTTTTQIGIQLGLNLGGDLFGGEDVPPVPPLALAALPMNTLAVLADEGNEGESGGGSELSAGFTFDFSHTLDITTTDEETFTQSKSISRTSDFLANHQYIYWQIWQDLTMYRVATGQTDAEAIAAGNPIGTVSSHTKVVYVQDYDMADDNGDDDDGNSDS